MGRWRLVAIVLVTIIALMVTVLAAGYRTASLNNANKAIAKISQVEEMQERMQEQLELQQKVIEEMRETLLSIQNDIYTIDFKPMDIPLDESLQEYAYYKSIDYGVQPEIIFEIIRRESAYTEHIVGYNNNGTKDLGLCQINEINWEWLKEEGMDVMNSYSNIEAGIYILSLFMDKYDDEEVAIACYAAGEGGMQQGHGFRYARSILEAI